MNLQPKTLTDAIEAGEKGTIFRTSDLSLSAWLIIATKGREDLHFDGIESLDERTWFCRFVGPREEFFRLSMDYARSPFYEFDNHRKTLVRLINAEKELRGTAKKRLPVNLNHGLS